MDSEIVITGAGVIGLAIAERLSGSNNEIFIIEKNLTFGQETSSRNSEVIHAGIYYREGSLKSKLCIRGKSLLYRFCEENSVPHKRCGKIIVATSPEEVLTLGSILETAARNGVDDLKLIGKDEVADLEPNVSAMKGIWSPSTGIIDSHSLMKKLETSFINNGGNIVYGSEMKGITKIKGGYRVFLSDADGKPFSFTTRVFINSAGLTSDLIARMAGINDESLRIRFCKGEYFRIKPPKNRMIGRLVYPVPHHNMEGIGIHVTVDLAGGVKLGPDVTWLDSNRYDYSVDSKKQEAFFRSAAGFLPFIGQTDIVPEMAGIRPKIQVPGGEERDFYIREEGERGLPGFINLIGMESPGLTSSLAIAEYVESLL